jgi:hypothetical protein
MDAVKAQTIIESLRTGIPPDGYTSELTVGRQQEIRELKGRLEKRTQGSLILKANYGAGKTHLLKFIKEYALEQDWVVSFFSLDSKSGVRFNRLDQIIGAICRNIKAPNQTEAGIKGFVGAACKQIGVGNFDRDKWRKITAGTQWSQTHFFKGDALYVALRALVNGDDLIADAIENWLHYPWIGDNRRATFLYKNFVESLRSRFRDPHPKEYYTRSDRLVFSKNDDTCWNFLCDLDRFAQAVGYKGFILCFDEFEDILSNLQNINYEIAAFWNLFEFFSAYKYSGQSYFAVTPGFVHKCKGLLMRKGIFDYDYSLFDELPAFEMTPINKRHLHSLSKKIINIHQVAYDWDEGIIEEDLFGVINYAAAQPIQDRVRQSIIALVEYLDEVFEESL